MAFRFHEVLGARVFGCSRRVKIRAAYERHASSFSGEKSIQLIYLTGGKLVFRSADQTVSVRPGEVILWESGELVERAASPGRPVSYWFFPFIPVGLEGRMSLEETGLPRVCRPRHRHAFSRNFTVLAGLLQEKAPGWQQACSVTALKILKDLAPESHAASDPSGPDDRLTEKRVGDALDFINVNYKKRLGVAQLSRIAKMHPAHFNRLFKRATGLTPHRYVLEKKIEKAKDFLLHFNESLTTTAVELGFHDYSHFCRVFRNITGTNPRQYKATASGARASGRFSRPSPG